MATFIDLDQGKALVLVNVEAVPTAAPHLGGRPGAQVIFHDGTASKLMNRFRISRDGYEENS